MNIETIKHERGSETAKASDLFVHIGDSELRGNLPVEGPFNAKLYKEVEEKQKLLAKLKEKNEKVLQQKAEIELQLEAQSNERNFIKSLKESNECQLEQERHLIKIAEIEKARLLRNLTEIQQRLQEKQERHKALTNIYENQKQLYDHLIQSDEAQQQLRKNFNDRIAGTEKSCLEIRKALENDNKIAMELEAYLKKLTKQIFDKQRELEKFKLGELGETAKIESVKRAIRKRDREQRTLKEKYMQTLATIGENPNNDIRELQKEKEGMKQKGRITEMKSKLTKVEKAIAEIDEKPIQVGSAVGRNIGEGEGGPSSEQSL
uniref:DUF4515 domain-containing protein n=1 Tax=Ascaris lumbricoides TaxID=6252 RepID=A0A9J2PG48_ASCLU